MIRCDCRHAAHSLHLAPITGLVDDAHHNRFAHMMVRPGYTVVAATDGALLVQCSYCRGAGHAVPAQA